jgi:drug/metabolite transporter (DMT)-like permease
MKEWRSVIYIIIGASSFGILSTLVKLAYDHGFDTGEVTGSQMFFGLLLLSLMTTLFQKWQALTIQQWLLLLLAGMTTGLTGIFYYSALQFVPASIGIVLLFQFTWMGVVAESVMDRKKPSMEKMIALALLLLGTILAGDLSTGTSKAIPFLGIVLGLLAAAAYAVFIIASGRLAPQVNPWMRSMVLSLGSLVLVWVAFPPVFLLNGSLRTGLWVWGLLLAFLGIVLPNLLFTYAVPKVGSGLATILGAVELPVAVLLSWFVLKENVGIIQWIGVFFILFGIVVAEVRFTKGQMETGN